MRRTLFLSAALLAVLIASAHAATPTRLHVATGIRDGHRIWVMKGQRVLIQGTRSFPDDGYATAGIFFKGKEIATTRSPLHGKLGAPNGVLLHFTARRLGAYKAFVKVFKTADPTTRNPLYQQAEKLIWDDYALLWVIDLSSAVGSRKGVTGWEYLPLDEIVVTNVDKA